MTARHAPYPLRVAAPRTGFVRLIRAGSDWLAVVLAWQDRVMQRHRLSELDASMLKDIGLTRAQADVEAGKPFWRL